MNPGLDDAIAAGFWSQLPRELVDKVFAEGAAVEVTAGLVVGGEGEGKLGLVLAGLFRMFMRAKSGRQVTVSYQRPGDTMGLTSALIGPCNMGLQALSAGSVWVLSAEALRRHALADARLAWAIAEESARRTYELASELADNAFGTVRQRVARHLLDLVVEGPDGGTLVAPISQAELANAVGSVREVVSRVLQTLRADGLVRPTQSGLEVLDATRLYEQSQLAD